MKLSEAMQALKQSGTAQNRKVYRRHGVGEKQFGVSYANLGKLQKSIRQDHALALGLWDSGVHDARVLATMVADPQQMKSSDLDRWSKDLDNYVVTDAFVKLASQSRFAKAKINKWLRARNEWVASAGWGLVACLGDEDGVLTDAEAEEYLNTLERDIHQQKNRVRHTMNMALICLGLRSEKFKRMAVSAASRIGKVEVDHGETNCKTPDAAAYIEKTWQHQRRKRAVC